MNMEKVITILKKGGIGVMPTDTIYGIVGSALNSEVVEKIYKLRKRSKDKPMIILISSILDLEKFNIRLSQRQKEFLEKNWPNPLSIILPCNSSKFEYLHRGKKSLAFRMPDKKDLLEILKQAGPLVAPSANFEGEQPAENISEAKKYFADNIDFYIDEGTVLGSASTLVDFSSDSVVVVRQGDFNILT